MDFARPESSYQGWDPVGGGSGSNNYAIGGGTATGGSGSGGGGGKFWNGILDKDELPPSMRESHLENIKRQAIAVGSQVWLYLRPDIPGSSSSNYKDLRRFRLFLLVLAGTATFFWIWAIYNTVHMHDGQDLGMYSFFTVIITSFIGLFKAKPNGSLDQKICIAMTVSHALVTLNYMLGVLFAFSVGTVIYWRFGTYCIAFCILWGYATYQGWKLGMSVVNLIESSVEEVEDVRLIF